MHARVRRNDSQLELLKVPYDLQRLDKPGEEASAEL
jgi:hypothetical protein